MTEQEIISLEIDLEECIEEAIAMGASPDEEIAIEIKDGKLFFYRESEIPEELQEPCAIAYIPDVEDADDVEENAISIVAAEMIGDALGL